MADEVQRLLIQIDGQDKLKTLNAELARELDYLKQLLVVQKQGVVGVNPATIQQAAGEVVRLNAEIAKVGRETKNYSNSALQLGYVLDDLANTSGSWERHLAAISNNIPGLVMSLGAGQGLAGVIGIISTSLIGLAPLAHKAWSALAGEGEGPDQVVKALETAEERLKRISSALQKILESTTPEAQTTKGLVEEMFAGEGPDLLSRVSSALTASGRGEQMTAEEKAGIAHTEATIAGMAGDDRFAGAQAVQERKLLERKAAAQKRIDEANKQAAGRMLAEAPTSAAARSLMGSLLGPDFAEDLGGLEPEARAAQDKEVEEAEAFGERARTGMTARRKEEEFQREQKRNEAQGNRNIRKFEREQDAESQRNKESNAAADIKARENAKRAAKELDRTAESEAMGASVSARDMQLDYARRGVAGAAAQRGMQFDPAVLDQMASSALANYKGGMTEQDAVFSALASKLQQMERLGQRFQQMMARGSQQFGGDNSGQFSQMSPFLQ